MTQALSRVLIYFVASFIQLPVGVQDLFIHLSSNSSLGYLVVFMIRLAQINPFLPLVPIILLIILTHFIVVSVQHDERLQKLRGHQNNIFHLPSRPSPQQQEEEGVCGSQGMVIWEDLEEEEKAGLGSMIYPIAEDREEMDESDSPVSSHSREPTDLRWDESDREEVFDSPEEDSEECLDVLCENDSVESQFLKMIRSMIGVSREEISGESEEKEEWRSIEPTI